jgi:ADP-ribose pyrophosphatase YjhB (NUDIX family)
MANRIKLKALAVLVNGPRTHHLVARKEDSTATPAGFHRLLGGNVEFGELVAECVAREILEETGREFVVTALLGHLENVFTFEGRPGHEVDFVFSGHADLDDLVPPEGGWMIEGDERFPVEWRPVEDSAVEIPLYPTGSGELVRRAISRGDLPERS